MSLSEDRKGVVRSQGQQYVVGSARGETALVYRVKDNWTGNVLETTDKSQADQFAEAALKRQREQVRVTGD